MCVDLYCYSIVFDGVFVFVVLVQWVYEKGVGLLVLIDYDILEGLLEVYQVVV